MSSIEKNKNALKAILGSKKAEMLSQHQYRRFLRASDMRNPERVAESLKDLQDLLNVKTIAKEKVKINSIPKHNAQEDIEISSDVHRFKNGKSVDRFVIYPKVNDDILMNKKNTENLVNVELKILYDNIKLLITQKAYEGKTINISFVSNIGTRAIAFKKSPEQFKKMSFVQFKKNVQSDMKGKADASRREYISGDFDTWDGKVYAYNINIASK